MSTSVHVILNHTAGQPTTSLAQIVELLAQSGVCPKITFVSRGHLKADLESVCNEYCKTGRIAAYAFAEQSAFCEAANNAASPEDNFLFFLSSSVMPCMDTLPGLVKALEANPILAGVNPLLLHGDYVAHMGTVADSQGFIHYLYEGLHRNDSLVAKQRMFQLAHEGACLMRASDFLENGGFNSATSGIAFFDLCLRIHARKKAFATVPEAHASLADRFDSWITCGLWNSLAIREKISPGMLASDYQAHVACDGFEYGISPWLWEGPVNLPEKDEDDPWLKWRRSNDPLKFISWLGNLDAKLLRAAVATAGEIPATFPCCFEWHKSQAEKKLAYAQKEGLETMRAQLEDWLRHAHNFRHRKLRPAMRSLQASGLYDNALDSLPAIYDSWLEISPGSGFTSMEPGACWPKIAVVMPVWNPPPDFLSQAIESVRRQTYGNWEFCIADDCSSKAGIRDLLKSYSEKDKRIKLVFRAENGHISRATNSALELVQAPFAAFLDHDDLLARDALAQTARTLAENPDLLFVYSDEDHINIDNVRRSPVFRPGFDRFLHFTGHLACYDTNLLKTVGGLRVGVEGCQDSDLSFRVMEKLHDSQVGHIAKILYHWRVHAGSTSAWMGTKSYVLEATRKMLIDNAKSRGLAADCVYSCKNIFRVVYDASHTPRFGIVLLDDKGHISERLAKCLRGQKKDFRASICWQPLADNLGMPDNLGSICDYQLKYAGAHWSAGMLNAAKHINCDVLLFISAALAPHDDCRPEQMAIRAAFANVAAVGANIHYRGHLWHGGLYPDVTGLPFALLRGAPDYTLATFNWGQMIRERRVIGISWHCMAIKRDIVLKGNLFNPQMGSLANADFSLRRQEMGEYTIISPWGDFEFVRQPCREMESAADKTNFLKSWQDKTRNHILRNANLRACANNDWTLVF